MNLKLAWRNLWRNKRRSMITIASIAFAVFFACLMMSMQLGSYSKMIENAVSFQTGYLQVQDSAYWQEKTLDNTFVSGDSLLSEIEKPEGISIVVPRLQSFALASYRSQTKGVMVIGMDPEREDRMTRAKSKLVRGTYLDRDDKGVLVSEGLASYLGIDAGDTLVMISQGYHGINAAGKYAIQGIVKFPSPEMNNQLVYMPLAEAQWFYGAENRLTALALMVNKPEQVAQVSQQLRASLPAQFEVMNWREMMPELVQSIELDYVSGMIMLYILYVVIGFGIFGTFLMMTNERRYEFGILISIGMQRLRLQWVMLSEIVLMGLIGVVVGILMSSPLIFYFHANPILMTGEYAELYAQFGMEPVLPFSIDPSIFFRQAIVVFIMAMIIGIYPVIAIQKLDPATAMRE